MTLEQLCEATITTSDNTAGNLILSSYGGPAALTEFARQLGDNVTRLDRNEPELNVKSGDGLMDTTSPRAMATTMQKLLLGNALSVRSREQLLQWLRGSTTGDNRLKAGLPTDWRIGDKTGTNKSDSNDIGIVFPSNRAPLLVTAYLAESHATTQVKDATIAAVGKLVREIAS
jgi:beta-lactamase class A